MPPKCRESTRVRGLPARTILTVSLAVSPGPTWQRGNDAMPLDLLSPADSTARMPVAPSFTPYQSLSDSELTERCWAAKKVLGDALLILGHHYQQDEVIAFADLRGDSYKLASLAAQSSTCKFIVFCGV